MVGACALYGRSCGEYGDCIDRLNDTSIEWGHSKCKCKEDAELDDGVCKENDSKSRIFWVFLRVDIYIRSGGGGRAKFRLVLKQENGIR